MGSKTANNFLDIPEEKQADFVIVPFGYEATVTYGPGAKNGPSAIISASSQVELFDEELWGETYKTAKIATFKTGAVPKNEKQAKTKLQNIIRKILVSKSLPIVLGGEHSITPFIIEEFINSGKKDFSILHFDAHADLRDGYLGKKYSHAAAMRRCLDLPGINLVQVGIRNISNENNELIFWEKNQARIKTFWAKDKANWKLQQILENLNGSVYLTFDVDVFDSAVMPATGTPEPGGIGWYESLNILRAVCKNKKIIGADFVELSPIKNLSAPDFLVAKLIYKTIGYLGK